MSVPGCLPGALTRPSGCLCGIILVPETVACVAAWIEDFRKDIARNDLPTMIIHGDDDRILPADVTSRRQAKLIKGVEFIEIKGGSSQLLSTSIGTP
jgi:pimeloyl-ACP methyl ester carboxylesterase